MSPRAWTTTLILAGLLTHGAAECAEPVGASQDELDRSFSAPPNEAKPWVYWWFEGGYGNPQGMARDIAAMKDKGIGGVMHMQTINAGGLPLPEQPSISRHSRWVARPVPPPWVATISVIVSGSVPSSRASTQSRRSSQTSTWVRMASRPCVTARSQ